MKSDPEVAAERAADAVRAFVAGDLAPVRPLWPPARRALLLLPMALAVGVFVRLFFGLRVNAVALGPAWLWGASLLQAAAGMYLLAAALREAIPGRQLGPMGSLALLGGATLLAVGVTAGSWITSPLAPPSGEEIRYLRVCASCTILLALPLLLTTGLLAARGFPVRPARLGLLAGAGAGLVGEAGWRIYCEASLPAHVVLAHYLPAIGLAVLGGLVGTAVDRERAKRRAARV